MPPKEPLKLTPIADLKKAVETILRADKARVDAEVAKPLRPKRKKSPG